VENKESTIILNWMSLNDGRQERILIATWMGKSEFQLGSVWFGSPSVDGQFQIKLSTSVSAGGVQILVSTHLSLSQKDLSFHITHLHIK